MIHFCVFYSPAFASRAAACTSSIRAHHPHTIVHEIPIDSEAQPGTYIEGFQKARFKWMRDKLASLNPDDRLIFVGADCVFYDYANHFLWTARKHDIVLTPHVVHPPRERAGALYVTGHANGDLFSFSPAALPVLDWLLEQDMSNNPAHGTFYEQTHLSSLPFIADNVAIYRRPDVNLAWFNFQERQLNHVGGRYYVNGLPLVMAHFTGYNKAAPSKMSRYSAHPLPPDTAIESLFRDYDGRI